MFCHEYPISRACLANTARVLTPAPAEPRGLDIAFVLDDFGPETIQTKVRRPQEGAVTIGWASNQRAPKV